MLQTVLHAFEMLADAVKSSPAVPYYLDPQQFTAKVVQWVNAFHITFHEVSIAPK